MTLDLSKDLETDRINTHFESFSQQQVTQLVITRPQKMHYRAGDYIFVLIPAIAKYEWHPFTISSAPEQAGKALVNYINLLRQWR